MVFLTIFWRFSNNQNISWFQTISWIICKVWLEKIVWSRRQKRQIGSCENSSVATIFSWFFWSFQYFLPVFKCPFRWFLKTPSVEVLWRPKTKFDRVEPSHALILCDEWKAGWTRFLEDGDQSCKRDKRICRGRGRQSHCHLCYKGKFRKWINFGKKKNGSKLC